jgi:MFS family permease
MPALNALFSTAERLTGLDRRGQGTVFLVALGHGGTHCLTGAVYLVLPFIARDLGLSYAEAGALISVFHGASVVSSLGGGVLVDLTGRRVAVMVAALLVGGCALVAMAGVSLLGWLFALVGLVGMAKNLWHPPAISYVSLQFPESRGYALSIHALGGTLGNALAPLAVGASLAWLSWRTAVPLAAVPAIAVAVLIAFVLAPRDAPSGGTDKGGMDVALYFRELAGLLRNKPLLMVFLVAGFRVVTQAGMLVFMPLYLANVLGAGPVWMGLSLTILQMGGVLAAPFVGTWSDRIGRKPVAITAMALGTVFLFALSLAGTVPVFIILVLAFGMASFSVRPVLQSWVMDLSPPALSGTATSLLFGVQGAFGALSPLIGGLIADTWNLTAVFYFLAAASLIATLLMVLAPGGKR